MNLKKSFVAVAAVSMLGLSGSALAALTSGQVIIINSLGVVVSGSPGASASTAKVVVNDATGPCSTTPIVAFGGVVTVKWDSTKTHSATQCTDITSVDVTAIKTTAGVVQYDSTANATPPAVAVAATTFTAPTTPIGNLALIVTGGTSAAMTSSATSWGSALGVAPIYLTTNGALSTTGIMGGVGMAGLKAESLMHRYAVMPAGTYAFQ